MENKLIKCGKLSISNSSPFTLIAGPCQLENEKHAIDIASKLKEITGKVIKKNTMSWDKFKEEKEDKKKKGLGTITV